MQNQPASTNNDKIMRRKCKSNSGLRIFQEDARGAVRGKMLINVQGTKSTISNLGNIYTNCS